MELNKIDGVFDDIFGASDERKRFFYSPGRVNLIGEHLDYNGGHVLPCAINLGNTIVLRKNGLKKVRAYSENFKKDGVVDISLNYSKNKKEHSWVSYVIGALELLNYKGEGFDVYVEGNLPTGAGLSSSASISCGLIKGISSLMGEEIRELDIALLAQQIEHKYIDVKCGIMDQYAIVFSKNDKAVALDTLSLKHKLVNFLINDYDLVISNTNKKRELKGSEYNDRRLACEKVSSLLHKKLAQATLEEIAKLDLDNDTRITAEYVVEEETRVKNAIVALEKNEIETFGELMNESHYGLRDKFRVSVAELDFVSQRMRELGSVGSRMTGAGFGGCTVSLIPKSKTNEILRIIEKEYKDKFGLRLDNYIVYPSNSVREVNN